MKTRQELCASLKELFQPELFEDYCPNGLQIEGKNDIRKGAFAVTASLAVIKEAEKWGADFLFVHHGLFWNRDPYPIVGTKKEKIEIFLRSGMSLIAYHLPLDAHIQVGNNWKAAMDLGWRELQPFSKIGVRGVFDPISRDDFLKKLENYYGHQGHTAFGGNEVITSAALISGGAHRETPLASKAGVEAFITGSFDEPVWHWAVEEKINFFAMGHSATEIVGPMAVMDLLKEQMGIEVRFINESNPF